MKHNAIRQYKHILELIENPVGVSTEQRNLVRHNAIINKAKMEERFRTAHKYINDPEIQALINPNKEEVKEDGKKSKR